MTTEIKPRCVSREELISGLREAIINLNDDSGKYKFGLILFGSRVNGTPKIDSDVDLFYLHLKGLGNDYIKSVRELGRRIDRVLLRWGLVHPFPYRTQISKKILLHALEDEDYRRGLLKTRLGILDKYTLYIGPGEEENQSLLERALNLSSREPYTLRW